MGLIPVMQGWINVQEAISVIHMNRLKKEHHMIISIGRQNSTPIHKNSKIEIGTFLNLIKII